MTIPALAVASTRGGGDLPPLLEFEAQRIQLTSVTFSLAMNRA